MPPGGSPTSTRIVTIIGLVLTAVLFSGYRPWGQTAANQILLVGPNMLAAGLASRSAQNRTPGTDKAGSTPAGRVAAVGLFMLLIGGCPWIYTPLFSGGESNQASGLIGTVIFLTIGLPGLAITCVGLAGYVAQKRRRAVEKPVDQV